MKDLSSKLFKIYVKAILKKRKKKSDKSVKNVTKNYQKIKSKSYMSIDKIILK